MEVDGGQDSDVGHTAGSQTKSFRCMYCPYEGRCFYRMLRHYCAAHEQEQGFVLTCGVDGCCKKFRRVRYFKQHLNGKHPAFYNAHVATVQPLQNSSGPSSVPMVSDASGSNDLIGSGNADSNDEMDVTSCQTHPVSTGDPKTEDLRRSVALQLLRLREERKLTFSSCTQVLEVLSNVVSIKDDLLSSSLLRDVEDAAVFQGHMDESRELFQSIVDEFGDERRFNKYVRENFKFVEPQMHGDRKNYFYYVPILESLKNLLSHDDVFAQVLSNHQRGDGILKDFCDGANFKTNPLFSNDHTSLQIMLYYDDFTCVNPIGHAAKDFKMGAIYFLLGNLEPEYRSKLNVIQLVMLVNSKVLKEKGFSTVLIPLLRDLKELESDGIDIVKPDGVYNFRGSISVVVADNLGSHSIGGFYESFNSLRSCRFCMATRDEMKVSHTIEDFAPRTARSYDNQADLIRRFPNMSSTYGLNQSSRLNELQYFHVANGLPSDIAHDLFEGVVCEVLTLVITHYVQSKIFSLKELDERIKNFPYKGSDKVNKPRSIGLQLSQLKIKQKAVQTWCLLRVFPVLVGDLVAEDDSKWKLVIALCDVVDAVTAPVLTRGEVLMIYDFLSCFYDCLTAAFPDVALKPKWHYMLHYPQQIMDFGPLIACWTLRFESFHSFFKETARRLKCRKNVPKSFSYRSQYYQALLHESQNYLSDTTVTNITNSKSVEFRHLDPEIKATLEPMGPNNIVQCSSMKIHGKEYFSGGSVVTGYSDQFSFEFCRIENCFLIDSNPYFLCKRLDIVEYSVHFHGYIVDDVPGLTIVQPQNLLDYYPLPIYEAKNDNIIVLHHKLSMQEK